MTRAEEFIGSGKPPAPEQPPDSSESLVNSNVPPHDRAVAHGEELPGDKQETAEPPLEGSRVCTACQASYVPDEDDAREVCPDCHDRRTAIWVVGLFLLFFCFVALPLLIQLLGTPRPDR